MGKSATLKGVITLDSSPFFKGINKAMTYARAAAKQFAAHPFKTTAIIGGLAGAGAVRGISSGLVKMAGIGVQAFKYLGIGALGAAAAIGAGTVKAFNLGGEMLDLSNRTGIAVGRLLIMRRALGDAGVQADELGGLVNKMQKFLAAAEDPTGKEAAALNKMHLSLSAIEAMSPDDQFEAIGKAIGGIQDPTLKSALAMNVFGKSGGKLLSTFSDFRNGGMKGAAEVIGKQAGILERDTLIFDKISDQLGHAGDKLQGFFIGVADRVASTISPMLDKLDKIDLADAGKKFGDGVVAGVQAIVGAFKDPKMLASFIANAFTFGVLSAGNVLIAVFKSGLAFFKDGFSDAIEAMGDVLLGTLTKAFDPALARFQAGIEFAVQSLPATLTGVKYRDKKAEDSELRNIRHAENEKALVSKDLRDGKTGMGNYEGASFRSPGTIAALDRDIAAAKKRLAAIQELPARGTIEQLTAAHLKSGAKIQIGDKEMSPDDLIAQGRERGKTAMDSAGKAFGAFKINDDLGAGAYKAKMQSDFEGLRKKGADDPTFKPEIQMIDPTTGKPVSAALAKQFIKTNGYSKKAFSTVFGTGAGEAQFNDFQRVNRKPISKEYEGQLRRLYGGDAYDNAARMGDPRDTLGKKSLAVNPGTGNAPITLGYGGVPAMGMRGIIGAGGALDGNDTRLRTGGLGGIGSATSTVMNGFDGNAFTNTTGRIHGYSSMRQLNADAEKAGINKKDPALVAQEATAANTAAMAKQLGATGSEE